MVIAGATSSSRPESWVRQPQPELLHDCQSPDMIAGIPNHKGTEDHKEAAVTLAIETSLTWKIDQHAITKVPVENGSKKGGWQPGKHVSII